MTQIFALEKGITQISCFEISCKRGDNGDGFWKRETGGRWLFWGGFLFRMKREGEGMGDSTLLQHMWCWGVRYLSDHGNKRDLIWFEMFVCMGCEGRIAKPARKVRRKSARNFGKGGWLPCGCL